MPRTDLTPVQYKMLEILSDGLAHADRELHTCLLDDLGPMSNIKAHLTFIKKYLAERNQLLVSQKINGATYYHITRQVRMAE